MAKWKIEFEIEAPDEIAALRIAHEMATSETCPPEARACIEIKKVKEVGQTAESVV